MIRFFGGTLPQAQGQLRQLLLDGLQLFQSRERLVKEGAPSRGESLLGKVAGCGAPGVLEGSG